MKRLVLLLALVIVLPVPGLRAMTLSEGWAHVQEALENGNAAAIGQAGKEFETLAHDLGVRRLTPYSRAMLAWSEANGGSKGRAAAALARRFDPWSPNVAFHESRVRWHDGAYWAAGRSFFRGWFLLLHNWDSRQRIVTTLVPWWLLALAVALAVGILLHTVRFLPELFHDGWELGRLLFNRSNAVVFAAVVVLLPLFAGLGPVWLVGWLFALSWSYLEPRRRVVAGVVWLLALAVVPAGEFWLHEGLHPAGAPERAVAMILERRADPSVLQALSELDRTLGRSATYHLVTGAVFRLHGDDLSARAHFQKAALEDTHDPRPLIFLGNVALEDGNAAGAIQYYNRALKRDDTNAMAYHNLSLAYDRTYRFEEADQMQRKAQELARREHLKLALDAPDSDVLDPPVGWADFERMRQEVGLKAWNAAGLGDPAPDLGDMVLHPVPISVFFTGLLGLLVFFARARWMWKSTACARCGKVFCPRCKTATESEAYCSQCISVFLKRDAVAIEQQAVKLEQIRRREAWENFGRRLASIGLPGGGEILLGRWLRGMVTAFAVTLLVLGALMWLPGFVRPVVPELGTAPVQVVLLILAAAVWLRSIAVSWTRR